MYTPSDLATISRKGIGVVRYMLNGNMFETEEGVILGENFLHAQARTNGMISLYELLSQRDTANLSLSLGPYTERLQSLGKAGEPFIRDFGSNGTPCFFAEGTAVSRINKVFSSKN